MDVRPRRCCVAGSQSLNARREDRRGVLRGHRVRGAGESEAIPGVGGEEGSASGGALERCSGAVGRIAGELDKRLERTWDGRVQQLVDPRSGKRWAVDQAQEQQPGWAAEGVSVWLWHGRFAGVSAENDRACGRVGRNGSCVVCSGWNVLGADVGRGLAAWSGEGCGHEWWVSGRRPHRSLWLAGGWVRFREGRCMAAG